MNLRKLIIMVCVLGLSSMAAASGQCHTQCASTCSPCTTKTTVRYFRPPTCAPAPCFSFSWGFPSLFYDDYDVVTYRRPCHRTTYRSCHSPCVKRVRYVSYDDCCDYDDDDDCW